MRLPSNRVLFAIIAGSVIVILFPSVAGLIIGSVFGGITYILFK